MSESNVKPYTELALPSNVITKIDVSRLLQEVEQVDNELTAAAVRTKITPGDHAMIAYSEMLTEFLSSNNLTLDNSHERSELITQLRLLKDKVPVIHMTFAVTADPESMQQLTQWVRTSVHPQAVIAVGLQPGLVAGVYMRTANRIHDLSLRTALSAGHEVLVKELEVLRDSN